MPNPYLQINTSFFGALEKTDMAEKKLNICKNCKEYVELTKHCKQCKCIMPLKVKLKGNNCPLGKHNALNEATI